MLRKILRRKKRRESRKIALWHRRYLRAVLVVGTEVHSGRKPSNTNIGVAETPLQQKYRLLLYDQLR